MGGYLGVLISSQWSFYEGWGGTSAREGNVTMETEAGGPRPRYAADNH